MMIDDAELKEMEIKAFEATHQSSDERLNNLGQMVMRLINDHLAARVTLAGMDAICKSKASVRSEAEIRVLREAILNHRRNIWGNEKVNHEQDDLLYEVLNRELG